MIRRTLTLSRFLQKHQSYQKLVYQPQRFQSTKSGELYANALQEKIIALEQSQPFFDRFIFYDPDLLATLPGPLEKFDPAVEFGKDSLVLLHDFAGIPWWGILGIACIFARTSLLPLIYVQMKRTSKLAAVFPSILQMKRLIDTTNCGKIQKLWYFTRVTFDIVRKQKLKFMRLMLYNLFHFPLLITLIWTIRRLLIEPSFQQTSFLWIQSLSAIDPFYILPLLTVGCHYYNFYRLITPENKHTLPSRLRAIGQFLMIIWLPYLCNWPSAIVLYMFYNAVFSVIQTSIMIHPNFSKFIDSKMALYQLILKMAEYDNQQSKALIEQIKSGEETLLDKAIEEGKLVEQMKKALIQLNQEEMDQKIKQTEDLNNKF